MESLAYNDGGEKNVAGGDGGDTNLLYEVGTKLTNLPLQLNNRTGAGAVLPTITTSAASNVVSSSVTLNGLANPKGDATNGWFRWETSNVACSSLPNVTTSQNLGTGTTDVAYSQNLSTLSANTAYYFCAVASNSSGEVQGSVLTFTTTDPPGWTWSGNGNTTFAGTTTWTTVATVPVGSTKIALSMYAMTPICQATGLIIPLL